MSNKESLRVLFLLVYASAASCGPEPAQSPPVTPRRCTQDGLCVVTQTKTVLSGAFRANGREIGFDSIYRGQPLLDAMMGGRDYCERLTLDNGHIFSRVSGGYCPKEWESPNLPEITSDPSEYWKMLEPMSAAMRAHGAPSGWQESWDMLVQNIDTLAEKNRDAAAMQYQDVERVDLLPQALEEEKSRVEAARTASRIAPELVYAPTRPDGQITLSLGVPRQDDKKLYRPTKQTLGPIASSGSSGRGDHGDVPETSPVEIKGSSAFEYRQQVDLWYHNVDSLLVAGWTTGNHHTASHILVYRRPLHCEQCLWTIWDSKITRNHGAQPGYVDMRRYEQCKNLPITSGRYYLGGECSGKWGRDHLCNDDTALQLYHAYGGWKGGSHCEGRKRFKRVGCAKPMW